MEEQKESQSFGISGSQLSNVQIAGKAGRDLTVNQALRIGEGAADKPPTPNAKTNKRWATT